VFNNNIILILDKKEGSKKKPCNKTFCLSCLNAYFPSFASKINQDDWKCPCCLDKCECASCGKLKTVSSSQKKSSAHNSKKKGIQSSHNNVMTNSLDSDEDFEEQNTKKEFDWKSLENYVGKFSKDKNTLLLNQRKEIIEEQKIEQYKTKLNDYLEFLKKFKEEGRNPLVQPERRQEDYVDEDNYREGMEGLDFASDKNISEEDK
ncbi:MAG: cell division cycle-associated 7 family protein, partial [archaeon]|nr:cell division cycle-associated 7 family protein [archaeon]